MVFGLSVIKKIPFYDDAHERMVILNSRTWREIFRTLAVISVLIAAICMDTAAQIVAEAFYAESVIGKRNGKFIFSPAFDVILSLIPNQIRVPKLFCDLSILLFTLIAFWATILYGPNQKVPLQGFTVLRRFCFILSITYIFHVLTTPFTLIPSVNVEKCALKSPQNSFATIIMEFMKMTLGQTVPCLDNSFAITIAYITNVAFFLMAYSRIWYIKLYAMSHALVNLLLLILSRYNYSVSISLGIMASVFTFGTYHLLLLVFCQSKIFLGVTDSASMGFDLFFLNGFFSKNAIRCINWVDGLDLRKLQPFVADLDKPTMEQSLFANAKYNVP